MTVDNLPSLAIDLQLLAPDATAEEIAHFAADIAARGFADLATIIAMDALDAVAFMPEKAPVLARLLAAIKHVTRADIASALLSVVTPLDAGRVGFAATLVESGVLDIGTFVEHVVLPALEAEDTAGAALASLAQLLDARSDARAPSTLNDAQRHESVLVELCSRRSFDIAVCLAAQLSVRPSAGPLLDRIAQSSAFQTSLFATLPASTTQWLEIVGSMAAAQQTAALDTFARLLHSSAGASRLRYRNSDSRRRQRHHLRRRLVDRVAGPRRAVAARVNTRRAADLPSSAQFPA